MIVEKKKRTEIIERPRSRAIELLVFTLRMYIPTEFKVTELSIRRSRLEIMFQRLYCTVFDVRYVKTQ